MAYSITEACSGCKACAIVCPVEAIEMALLPVVEEKTIKEAEQRDKSTA